MAATLANFGECPLTGVKVCDPERACFQLSSFLLMMMTYNAGAECRHCLPHPLPHALQWHVRLRWRVLLPRKLDTFDPSLHHNTSMHVYRWVSQQNLVSLASYS